MATAKNLNVQIDGKSLFATPTGLRMGSKGKVVAPGNLFGVLSKSESRQIRKALRRVGEAHKAGAFRVNYKNADIR